MWAKVSLDIVVLDEFTFIIALNKNFLELELQTKKLWLTLGCDKKII